MEARRGFIRSITGEIESAIVPREDMPAVFLEGDTLVLLKTLDLSPYAMIPAGVQARVLSHCAETGVVQLEFTDPVPGLHHWSQLLTLVPFDTDEALDAFNTAMQLMPNGVVEAAA